MTISDAIKEEVNRQVVQWLKATITAIESEKKTEIATAIQEQWYTANQLAKKMGVSYGVVYSRAATKRPSILRKRDSRGQWLFREAP